MFSVGQYVIYGLHGVCKVEAVGALSFLRGKNERYYTLKPTHATGGTKFYVPIGSDAQMRTAMTKEDALSSLSKLQTMDVKVCCYTKVSALSNHYEDLIAAHDPDGYLRLYKEVCRKEQRLSKQGKKLGLIDRRFYDLAEKLLCGELSVALDETPEQAQNQLRAAACA